MGNFEAKGHYLKMFKIEVKRLAKRLIKSLGWQPQGTLREA